MGLERWLHDLGYDYFELGRLSLIEIDRLLYAEKLRALFASGITPGGLRAVARYRKRRAQRQAKAN